MNAASVGNHITLSVDSWGDMILRRIGELSWQEDRDISRCSLRITSKEAHELGTSQTGGSASVTRYIYGGILHRLGRLQDHDTITARSACFLQLTQMRTLVVNVQRLFQMIAALRLMQSLGTLPALQVDLYILVPSNLEEYIGQANADALDWNSSYGNTISQFFRDLVYARVETARHGGIDLAELMGRDPETGLQPRPHGQFAGKRTVGDIADSIYVLSTPSLAHTLEEADYVAQRVFMDIVHPEADATPYRGYLSNLPGRFGPDCWPRDYSQKNVLENRGVPEVLAERLPLFSTIATASVSKPLRYLTRHFQLDAVQRTLEQFVLYPADGLPAQDREEAFRIARSLGLEVTASDTGESGVSADPFRFVELAYGKIRKRFHAEWYGSDPYEVDGCGDPMLFVAAYETWLSAFVSSETNQKTLEDYVNSELDFGADRLRSHIHKLLEDPARPEFSLGRTERTLEHLNRMLLTTFFAQQADASPDTPPSSNEDQAQPETDKGSETEQPRTSGSFAAMLESCSAVYEERFRRSVEQFQAQWARNQRNRVMRFLMRAGFVRRRRFMIVLRGLPFESLLLARLGKELAALVRAYVAREHATRSGQINGLLEDCQSRLEDAQKPIDIEEQLLSWSPTMVPESLDFGQHLCSYSLNVQNQLSHLLLQALTQNLIVQRQHKRLTERRNFRHHLQPHEMQGEDIEQACRSHFFQLRANETQRFLGDVMRARLKESLSGGGRFDFPLNLLVRDIETACRKFVREDMGRPDSQLYDRLTGSAKSASSGQILAAELDRLLDSQLAGTVSYELLSRPERPATFCFQQFLDSEVDGEHEDRVCISLDHLQSDRYPMDAPFPRLLHAYYLEAYAYRELHRLSLLDLRKAPVFESSFVAPVERPIAGAAPADVSPSQEAIPAANEAPAPAATQAPEAASAGGDIADTAEATVAPAAAELAKLMTVGKAGDYAEAQDVSFDELNAGESEPGAQLNVDLDLLLEEEESAEGGKSKPDPFRQALENPAPDPPEDF